MEVVNENHPEALCDFEEMEVQFKKDKTRVKSNLTQSRNKLLDLLDQDDLPSRKDVRQACQNMDTCQAIAIEVLTNFSDFYTKNGEKQKRKLVVMEMIRIEEDFYMTSESAREYLESRKSDNSSVSSDILSIDLLERMNISDQSETNRKQGLAPFQNQTVSEVNSFKFFGESVPDLCTARDNLISPKSTVQHNMTFEKSPLLNDTRHDANPQYPDEHYANPGSRLADTSTRNVPFENLSSAQSIGHDLWRQLKRVQIPVFSGEKRQYQNWKAAFLACIDSAPATDEYKLLQLRQYLSGNALKVIENLGHSAYAYKAAKERLDRKYGGKRRQIAIYLEDLENFRQIRLGNARDLENFADLLDIAIINLKEAGLHHELQDGSLYTKLQRKLPESLLARYHRWVFENSATGSVLTLRTWVIQESEFQTVATETVHGLTGQSSNQASQPFYRNNNQRAFFGETTEEGRRGKSIECQLCKEPHRIWNCQHFADKSVTERWNLAKLFQLCYRCLGEWHVGKKCPRSRQCGYEGCQELHHRLLHRQRYQSEITEQPPSSYHDTELKGLRNKYNKEPYSNRPEMDTLLTTSVTYVTEGKGQSQQTSMTATDDYRPDYIALRTIPVILRNGDRSLKVNALLDDGSTKSYINADVAAELGLQGKTEKVMVNVLNGQVETFESKPVEFQLESMNGSVNMTVNAYTANRVTGDMRVFDWNKCKSRWPYLKNIDFPHSTKREIVDLLIGLDCAYLHSTLEEVRGKPSEPIARLTPLGWTCVGNPGQRDGSMLQTNFASTFFVKDQSSLETLNANLKKFWEFEEEPLMHEPPVIRLEEKLALQTAEHSINYENQMYRVGVPWKERQPVLPNNYDMALRRLENTEKRLKRSPDIADSYSKCIEQYIEKGYVRKIMEHEKSKSKWYLPHFPVIRLDKETTKTRIVFDASAKYDGVSLNDIIHQGPKLQRDLFDVLLRFRRFPVAVVCDIAEMYLRIGITPEDKPYHRFLWRGINQNSHPDIYEFDRVVFGVNSSPFQAQFVLQYHAQKCQKDFPVAAEIIQKSTYMDDSMDSTLSDENAIELYKQLSRLFTKAGMHARKWLSNSSTLLSVIPQNDRKAEVDLDRDQLPSAKTLGVWWVADRDEFTYKENAPDDSMVYTKRNFLKKIATLFDPIGFIAPFTIRAKILLQDMWTTGLEWDEELTESLTISARAWFNELTDLKQLQIPRCLFQDKRASETISLHIFVDASENAYGAVVYARCLRMDGCVTRNIVAAKTRVAPTISTSIPRLELMAAVVGARLAMRISKVLDISVGSATFWSDSANVLWWIRGRSRQFKPFVANRVGEIQGYTNPDQWRYVPTELNPADFLSRGMKATDLIRNNAWWRGPDFLGEPEETWPINKNFVQPSWSAELKRSTSTLRKTKSKNEDSRFGDSLSSVFMSISVRRSQVLVDPNRYSSWLKLKRIQAWVDRFIENCQKLKTDRMTGELSADELNQAEIKLIKETQSSYFPEEYESLKHEKVLSSSSKLLGLQPKLDSDGLMRSDSRLKHAKFLSYDVRYPVILPRKSWVTKLIVKEFHEKGRHATGTNQTLSALSARYWIVSAREVIREFEKACAECRRRKAKACEQSMAPLPISRLKMSLRAFTRTAVDFGGPFITVQGRGKRRAKRYLCLFTCLATRAVHLEIAFGLDTDSFLNSFYRMASRRGLPEEVYSDNGTNFKGADNELKLLVSQIDEDKITESAANKGVKWHFNPPLAPHFGGVHEAMIKSAKRAISAILGNADINDEELMTAIIGAEGLINSRPLTYQSANPVDDVPLTPNHFLHGQIGGQFAPTSVDSTQFNLRKRWRRIQELVRHFWQRWLREWLPALAARKKWTQERQDVKVGDVVLVVSPDTSRGNWPLGRVLEVYPGTDGRVRVVKVQVGQGTLVRSVTKLCPLECDQ